MKTTDAGGCVFTEVGAFFRDDFFPRFALERWFRVLALKKKGVIFVEISHYVQEDLSVTRRD